MKQRTTYLLIALFFGAVAVFLLLQLALSGCTKYYSVEASESQDLIKIPQTDEDVYFWIEQRYQFDKDLVDMLKNLYDLRRFDGDSVLDAYLSTLSFALELYLGMMTGDNNVVWQSPEYTKGFDDACECLMLLDLELRMIGERQTWGEMIDTCKAKSGDNHE